MPVYRLGDEPAFPDPADAEPDGLLAVGGDLHPTRLIAAYSAGIFPWYEQGLPILWWSPDPRMVLEPHDLHVSRSLARTVRRKTYTVTADTEFVRVMRHCAGTKRPGQKGTWITEEMVAAYLELHEMGYAHSVETWKNDQLVGGLYGLSLGNAFFGESMFAIASDASKVAMHALVQTVRAWNFDFIDCQVTTRHLTALGAHEVARSEFLVRLAACLEQPTRRGPWTIEAP